MVATNYMYGRDAPEWTTELAGATDLSPTEIMFCPTDTITTRFADVLSAGDKGTLDAYLTDHDFSFVSSDTAAEAGTQLLVGTVTRHTSISSGVIIDQGGADDAIFALKSSGLVAHGHAANGGVMPVETDDYLVIGKSANSLGGALYQAIAEDAVLSNPMRFQSLGGTADITKSAAGIGLVDFIMMEHNGADVATNVTADGNIFSLRPRVAGAPLTVFLVDEDGDLMIGGNLSIGGIAAASGTGLTIQQGGSDDHSLTILSTDLSTGLSTAVEGSAVAPTVSFAQGKLIAQAGGVHMKAMVDNSPGGTFTGWQSDVYVENNADTTKSTAGRGLFEFYASQHTGANALADIVADGNILSIRAEIGSANVGILLLDVNGDLMIDGSMTIGGVAAHHGNMTDGLTINQQGADDLIFALKSSDVATGLTTGSGAQNVETNDFFVMTKSNASNGGVQFMVLAVDAALSSPFVQRVIGGTADTTKSTAGVGLVNYLISENNGANAVANITADGNIFSIRATTGGALATKLLLDEDGDLMIEGALTVGGIAAVTNSSTMLEVAGGDVIVQNGNGVIVGHTGPITGIANIGAPQLQVLGNSGHDDEAAITVIMYSPTDGDLARLILGKSASGTLGNNSLVADGEGIGSLIWVANDGTDLNNRAADILVQIDGTPAANDIPGRIMFRVGRGAAGIDEAMRINSSQEVIFGAGEGAVTVASNTGLIRAANLIAGGAGDIAGADLTFAAGLGTGVGDVGQIIFSLPIVAAAGDNIQTIAPRLTMDMVGSSTVLTMNYAQATTISTGAGDYTISPSGSVQLTTSVIAQSGLRIGADSSDNEIDDATQGAASTQLFIGNSSIDVTSDIRIKQDIVPTVIDAMGLLNRFRVVDFTWNDPSDQSEYGRNYRGRYTGMIAQEMIGIAPWIINDQGGGRDCSLCMGGQMCSYHVHPWKVEYEHLVPTIVKGVQELYEEIEELKARVVDLENN